jgi:hypothetical protein
MQYILVHNGMPGGGFVKKTIPLYFSLDLKGCLILTLSDGEHERKLKCKKTGAQDIVNIIQEIFEVFEDDEKLSD